MESNDSHVEDTCLKKISKAVNNRNKKDTDEDSGDDMILEENMQCNIADKELDQTASNQEIKEQGEEVEELSELLHNLDLNLNKEYSKSQFPEKIH